MVGQCHSRGHADKQRSDGIFLAFSIYRHDSAARPVVDKTGEKGEVIVLSGSQSVQDVLMGGKDIGRAFGHCEPPLSAKRERHGISRVSLTYRFEGTKHPC